jgi:hypothetical protein
VKEIAMMTPIATMDFTVSQSPWVLQLKFLGALVSIHLRQISVSAGISMMKERQWKDQMESICLHGWKIHLIPSWDNVKVIATMTMTVCLVCIASSRRKEK